MQEKPRILAHRGSQGEAPENTLAAFSAAMDLGADGVELDVRATRTGEVVVFHDETLERLTGDPRPLAWLGRADLDRVRLPGDHAIPTLEEALELVLGRGGVVNVEVKGDVPEPRALSRRVRECLLGRTREERSRILLSSFRPRIVAALSSCGVPVGFLFDEEHTGRRRAAALIRLLGPDGLHPHHPLVGEEEVARWRKRGLYVNAWTVNDPRAMRRLAAAGVDGIITDDVPLARRVLGRD